MIGNHGHEALPRIATRMVTRTQIASHADTAAPLSTLGKRNRQQYQAVSDSIASDTTHDAADKRRKVDSASIASDQSTSAASLKSPVPNGNEHAELWAKPYSSSYHQHLAYGVSNDDAKHFLNVSDPTILNVLRTHVQQTTLHEEAAANQIGKIIGILFVGSKPNHTKPAIPILKHFLYSKTPRLDPPQLKALDPIINRRQLPHLHDIARGDAKSYDYSVHRLTNPLADVRSVRNTQGYMEHLQPNSKIPYLGYVFHTDELARPVKVTGSVGQAANHLDSWDHKLDVGWSDRIRRGSALASMQGYDYGMQIVPNGPYGFMNLASMHHDISAKGGEWEMLQRLLAHQAAAGKNVQVDIALEYPANSHRPETLHARYTIAGDHYATNITNRKTSQFFRSPTSLQHQHAQATSEKPSEPRLRIGDSSSKYVISNEPQMLAIREARETFHSLLTGLAKTYGLPVDPTRQFLANPHGELAESTYKAYFSGTLTKDRFTNLHRVIHTEPERLPVAFENLLNMRTRDIPARTNYLDYNPPNATYKYRQLTWKTDHLGRPASVTGIIFHSPQQIREENEQKAIGWSERVRYDKTTKEPGDHGGHLVARSLGGPPETYNLIAQNALMNAEPKAEWFEMERFWKDAVSKEKHVGVHITPEFEGNSQRPHAIQVRYQIDGEFFRSRIPNPKGKVPPEDLRFDAATIYAEHVVPMSFTS